MKDLEDFSTVDLFDSRQLLSLPVVEFELFPGDALYLSAYSILVQHFSLSYLSGLKPFTYFGNEAPFQKKLISSLVSDSFTNHAAARMSARVRGLVNRSWVVVTPNITAELCSFFDEKRAFYG